MRISELIEKLEKEKQKYGNLEVLLHSVYLAPGKTATSVVGPPRDVATYDGAARCVWISTEEAE